MTRLEAQFAGASFYNGKICQKHEDLDGLRYISNCECVGCARIRKCKYRAENKEKMNAYRMQYYQLTGK